MCFWKDFLFKIVRTGPFSKRAKRAVRVNPALPVFIWARYAAVSCLRGEQVQLDPTDGKALNAIFK